MSTPIVAGVAALVRSEFPAMTLEQVVERIEETGVPWECDLTTRPGVRMETARIDAFCALTSLNDEPCVNPPPPCPE